MIIIIIIMMMMMMIIIIIMVILIALSSPSNERENVFMCLCACVRERESVCASVYVPAAHQQKCLYVCLLWAILLLYDLLVQSSPSVQSMVHSISI